MINLSLLQKLAPSDEDLKLIKDNINAEYEKINAGEKQAINLGANKSHFLPSPSVLFNFLGFKLDILTTIEKLETVGVKPPAISRSSLYDLQGQGVGKRTYKKYLDWAIDAPLPYLDNLIEGRNPQLDASAKTNSNAFQWLCFLESIKSSAHVNDDELRPEYTPLTEFIQYRCDTEVAFQQRLREQGKYGESDLSNSDIWWKLLAKPFFAKHTVLTLDALDSVDTLMANRAVPQGLSESEKNILYKNALRLKFDFILSAIAHYEVGYALTLCPTGPQPQSVAPLACHAIKKYAASDENRTCFGWALQIFKDWCSTTRHDISWREIARNIPVEDTDPTCESGTTYTDKQYSRLKDWRKGKNLPSNALLTLFVGNITGAEDNTVESDGLFILFRITMGLDKILTNLMKQSKQEFDCENQVEIIWKDVLSHYYEDYYLHYLNQHLARETQIEKI